ncbi:hypothetical protein WJ971_29780 [Achromobacter xylosoxidans]
MPPDSPDLPAAPIGEDDIRRLVHRFYARVRQDDTLAPIFDARDRLGCAPGHAV